MLLLRNVCILDTKSPFNGQNKDVFIENGVISQIATPFSLNIENCEVVEGEGLCMSPGWVDMQVHLSEPGYEWKETVTQTIQAAVRGGFTTILAYPHTQPAIDNAQTLQFLVEKTKNANVEFLFTGTLTQATKGKDYADIFEMHQLGAVAFTDGLHYPQSSGMMLRLRQYLSGFGGRMMIYPFDETLVGEGMMNEGNAAVHLGMKGIPEMAEYVALTKELALHEYAKVPTHFQPMTSPMALTTIQLSKEKYPEISCGISAFYLDLIDEDLHDFDTNLKVFPPLRSKEQVQILKEFVQNGTIDVITSGHYPQGLEEKMTEFDVAEMGMLGLQTAFSVAVKALDCQNNTADLAQLIDKFTHNPRKILGQSPLHIEEKQKATLTLFYPQQSWSLQKKDIPSTAKNSPYIGKELPVVVQGIVQKGNFIACHS